MHAASLHIARSVYKVLLVEFNKRNDHMQVCIDFLYWNKYMCAKNLVVFIGFYDKLAFRVKNVIDYMNDATLSAITKDPMVYSIMLRLIAHPELVLEDKMVDNLNFRMRSRNIEPSCAHTIYFYENHAEVYNSTNGKWRKVMYANPDLLTIICKYLDVCINQMIIIDKVISKLFQIPNVEITIRKYTDDDGLYFYVVNIYKSAPFNLHFTLTGLNVCAAYNEPNFVPYSDPNFLSTTINLIYDHYMSVNKDID